MVYLSENEDSCCVIYMFVYSHIYILTYIYGHTQMPYLQFFIWIASTIPPTHFPKPLTWSIQNLVCLEWECFWPHWDPRRDASDGEIDQVSSRVTAISVNRCIAVWKLNLAIPQKYLGPPQCHASRPSEEACVPAVLRQSVREASCWADGEASFPGFKRGYPSRYISSWVHGWVGRMARACLGESTFARVEKCPIEEKTRS